MLYFAYGAPNYQPTVEAVVNVQYVMGDTPEDIHRTFLLRDRYYRMLNDEVVDLFKAAKDYAEELFGRAGNQRARIVGPESDDRLLELREAQRQSEPVRVYL